MISYYIFYVNWFSKYYYNKKSCNLNCNTKAKISFICFKTDISNVGMILKFSET